MLYYRNIWKLKFLIFQEDPLLEKHRFELIRNCSRKLDKARMIRFDERTSFLYPTNLGRTASNYYIDFDTIEVATYTSKDVESHIFVNTNLIS